MRAQRIRHEHLDAVAALEAGVFHAPWSAQALALLTGESGIGFVVMQDGVALAYGGMLTVLDEGQITNIATHPEYRRRGYGAAVLEALLHAARERGLAQITLEVRESNRAARALYERYGFTVVGSRPRFYTHPTENALIMACTLDRE